MKKFMSVLTACLIVLGTAPGRASARDSFTFTDESFEEYAPGTKLSETGIDGLTVKDSAEGDSVTVEKDPVSGTNAVRIQQKKQEVSKNSNPETGFEISFDKINRGVAEVGFSVRADSISALFNNSFVLNSSGARIGTYYHYTDSLFFNGMGNYLATLNSKNYVKFLLTFDFENNTYSVKATANGKDTFYNAKATLSDISKVTFYIAANYRDGAEAWVPKINSDAVYWIDDVYVRQLGLSVTGTKPENGAVAAIDADVSLDFNVNIDAAGVADSVSVYENGVQTGSERYSTDAADNRITLTFPGLLEYNSEYRVVLKQGIKAAQTQYLPLPEDYEYTFTTQRMFDKMADPEEGGVYSDITPVIPQNPRGTIEAVLKTPGGEEKAFVSGTRLTEVGDYVLTVTGTDTENGKTQTDIYHFRVVGNVAPAASQVKIGFLGELKSDSVLRASYVYSDINDKPGEEKEGKSLYKWYCCDTPDGEFKLIEGADGLEYALTEHDKNKYFKFSVTPVSTEEPYEGEETMSEVFTGFFLPKAENVKILGEMKENGELGVSFDYFDANNQERKEEKYCWYRSTDGGKTFEKIGTEKTYTVTKDDCDCLIKAGVTPVKSTAEGEEVFSEAVYGLMRPTVSDIKINGSAKVGQSIYVSYVYSDLNGDEGECEVKWYADTRFLQDGDSLVLTKGMAGMKVHAELTPKAKNYPYDGDAVKSESVTVSANISKGGSGGGGGASAMPAVPKAEDGKKNDETKEPTEPKPSENEIFSDIKGHWAAQEIAGMYEKGIVNGMGDGTFNPDGIVTRAQFAAMISKAFADMPQKAVAEIKDISADKWYYEAVLGAAERGLMSGADGFFRPEDNITREEMAVVINNILNSAKEKAGAADFADSSEISDWAKDAVGFAHAGGILTGRGGNMFFPKANATRAEALTVISRMLRIYEVKNEKVQ